MTIATLRLRINHGSGMDWRSIDREFWLADRPTSPVFLPRSPRVMAMLTELELTTDELVLMHLLVQQEIESSRVELHHTCGIPHRASIKQRLEQSLTLFTKLNDALSTAGTIGAPSAALHDTSPALLNT